MASITYLEYSNSDIKYARDMFDCGNWDPCGRYCQQSVEKRMKHYIEKNGDRGDIALLGAHALVPLYRRVCEIAGAHVDKTVRGDLYELSSYYFDTNYPKKINIELDRDMACEAIRIMDDMNKWIDGL